MKTFTITVSVLASEKLIQQLMESLKRHVRNYLSSQAFDDYEYKVEVQRSE